MKYRHAFHAGNFADVHKHVALIALLRALSRKDKGFLYVDTHAGRGEYSLHRGDAARTGESDGGAEKLLTSTPREPEVIDYLNVVRDWRSKHGPHAYPGSPLIAANVLRAVDRGIAVEMQPEEFEALRSSLGRHTPLRAEHGDGLDRLRSALPPVERRGLVFIDPAYEDAREDFRQVGAAVVEALRRFETGVIAWWYPVKDARDSDRWVAEFVRTLQRPAISGELWIHPADSRAGLNGSGLMVVNPPYRFDERLQAWQTALADVLGERGQTASHVRVLRGE